MNDTNRWEGQKREGFDDKPIRPVGPVGPVGMEHSEEGQAFTIRRADITLYECDYCGGWEEGKNTEHNSVTTDRMTALSLDDATTGDGRKLCVRCLIKLMDKVLGKPFKYE